MIELDAIAWETWPAYLYGVLLPLAVLLSLCQSFANYRYHRANTEDDKRALLRTAIRISPAVILADLSLVGAFYYEMQAWPGAGRVAYLIQIVAGIDLAYQLGFLAYCRSKNRLPAGVKWLLQIPAFVVGLFFFLLVPLAQRDAAMRSISDNFSPLVALLHESSASCITMTRYWKTKSARAPYTSPTLYVGGNQFVLRFDGRLADVDGSTVYYFSGSKKWKMFYNDNTIGNQEFEDRIRPMERCRVDWAT